MSERLSLAIVVIDRDFVIDRDILPLVSRAGETVEEPRLGPVAKMWSTQFSVFIPTRSARFSKGRFGPPRWAWKVYKEKIAQS
jgi:hypothetical protein